MSVRSEQIVRDLLDARLDTQPQTRHLYFTDPAFHSAVGHIRTGLVTVADVMDRRGLGWAVRDVLTDTLADLLDDRRIDEADMHSAEGRLAALLATDPNWKD